MAIGLDIIPPSRCRDLDSSGALTINMTRPSLTFPIVRCALNARRHLVYCLIAKWRLIAAMVAVTETGCPERKFGRTLNCSEGRGRTDPRTCSVPPQERRKLIRRTRSRKVLENE